MTLVGEELSQSLPHIWFKSYILTLEPVDELRVFPREAAHMGEVDIHGTLLLNLELFGDFDIILDQLSSTI